MSALTALLDRESELGIVEALLATARGGAGSVLVLEGAAGIGKTRLLQEICERARGLEVLTARGGELERDMAFGVVRQLFEVVLARRPRRVRNALFSDAAAPAGRLLGTALEVEAASVSADPFQMLHALYWLLANMSESAPLLLIIDDAHWADQPSLRFVRYLLPRLAELPVMVVLATRPVDPTASLVLAEILVDPLAHVERLMPLSEAAIAAALATTLGQEPHPRFTQACHRVSGGNPFLLSELVRELAHYIVVPSAAAAARVDSITPPAVTRAVMVRLARLPDAAQSVARALAVLEAGQLRYVAALAGLNLDTAAWGADMLCAAGILDEGDVLRFAHPLLRSAIYCDLPVWQRVRTHRAAARLLAQDGHSLDEAAAHLLLTEPDGDPSTVDVLHRAAYAASTRGAPDVAAVYLRRALAEPLVDESRAGLLFDFGMAQVLLGDERGIGCLLESVHATNDPYERARRTLVLADLLVLAGRLSDAVKELDQADAGLSTNQELGFAVWVRRAFYGRFDVHSYLREAGNLHQLLHEAVVDDGPVIRELLVYCALDALHTASTAEASALLNRALAPPGLLAFHPCQSLVVGMALTILAYLERFDEFDALVEAALADVRRRNAVLGFVSLSHYRAVGDMKRGRLHEVETGVAAALHAVPMEKWGFGGASLLGPLVAALVERGELRRAEHVLEPVQLRDEHVSYADTFLRLNRGRLRLAQGNAVGALRDFLEAGEHLEAIAMHSPAIDSWRCLAAQAHLRLGAHEPAALLAEQDLGLARRLAGPAAQGLALCTLGMAVGGNDGIDLLHQAVATLQPSQARLEFAHALIELGAALRRSNRRTESRDPLRRGLELAHRLGAAPLADRARVELAATGARPRRIVLSGVDALTVSERRVADLAATGMTNHDIAQALFVSTKTVEKHLGGTYLKLGNQPKRAS
jgi:DNA-binding NarL/FixJ family response regulator